MDLAALKARWLERLAPLLKSLRSEATLAAIALSLAVLLLGGAALPGLVPELPEGWNREREQDDRDIAGRMGARPDPIALLAISPEPLAAPLRLDALTEGPAPEAGGPAPERDLPAIATRTPPSPISAHVGELHLLTGWGPGPDGAPAPEIGMARSYAIDRIVAPDKARETIKRAVFPKWSGVMEKSYAWDADFDGACGDIVGKPCGLELWQSMLKQLEPESALVQLDQVNKMMNQVRYREDHDAWGISDYWATPGEFFAYGGDCEDYAVAKYYSLRTLGFAAEKLRIVVLEDVRLQRVHAVLVVHLGERELMLDNQYRNLVDWKSADDYKPFYSVNEETFEVFDALREKQRSVS